MNIPALHAAQHSRSERAIAHQFQLHAAAHGLRDAVRPTQRLHLHAVLGLAPGVQAGFQGVRGGRDARLRRGRARGGGQGDFLAEGVGETWGGGGAVRCSRQADGDLLPGGGVACRGGVVCWGGDAEGLFIVIIISFVRGYGNIGGSLIEWEVQGR